METVHNYKQTNCGLKIATCDTHTMAAVGNDLWVAYGDSEDNGDKVNLSQTGLDDGAKNLGFFSPGTFTKVDHPFDNSGIKSIACNEMCSMVLTNLGNIFISGKFIKYNTSRFVHVDTISNIHFIKCIDDTFVMVGGPDVTVYICTDTIRSMGLGLHIDEIIRIFFLGCDELILDTGKAMKIYDLSDSIKYDNYNMHLDLRGMEEAEFAMWRNGLIKTLDIQANCHGTFTLVKVFPQDGTMEKYYINQR